MMASHTIHTQNNQFYCLHAKCRHITASWLGKRSHKTQLFTTKISNFGDIHLINFRTGRKMPCSLLVELSMDVQQLQIRKHTVIPQHPTIFNWVEQGNICAWELHSRPVHTLKP